MSEKYQALLAVLLWAACNTDFAAHRDDNASRRFKTLPGDTVQGEVDKSRNARWHRLGMVQRLLSVAAFALVAYLWLHRNGVAGVLAFAVGGCLTVLLFDIDFNIRFGAPSIFYTGHTSVLDERASGKGKQLAGLKAAGLVLSILAWIAFV